MSSSDAGPRKRFKDKKRKKGSVGEHGAPSIQQHDTEHKKFVLDETIHVQKDVHIGGNIFSKLIFISVLLLLGISLMYMLNQNNIREGSDNAGITPWLVNLISTNYFWSKEKEQSLIEQNDDIQPEEISQYTYWDYLSPFFSFLRATYEEPENFEKNLVQEVDDDGNLETEEKSKNEKDDHPDDFSDKQSADSDEREDNEDDENEYQDRNLEDDQDSLEDNDRDDDDDSDDDNEEGGSEPTDQGYVYQSSRSSYEFDADPEDHSDENSKHDADDDENDSSEEEKHEVTRDDPDEENDEEYYGNEETDYHSENSHEEDQALGGNDSEEAPDSSSEDQETRSEDELDSKLAFEDEPKPSHVITKLGVGVALIFVAYTVIIRKWNNYVGDGQQSTDTDEVENANDQDAHTSEVYSDRNKSEILQAYMETSTPSESEDEEKYSPVSGGRISAHEIEDSESYTGTSESDMNESDIEPSATFDRYASGYGKANITNEYDWRFRDDLDDADEDFDRGKLDIAMEKYNRILQTEKNSVRARYGIAKIFDRKAELLRSNQMLANAIREYEEVLRAPNVPDILLKSVLDRVIDRMRFKGDYDRTIPIQEFVIKKFPDEVKYRNDLVVSLLMLNRMSVAEIKLKEILEKWPKDGMALVHYGFVLKLRGNLTEAIDFLRKGIHSQETGTQDGRFYFHLGDALQKLKRDTEAMQVYEEAVSKKLFPSKYQRSLYNVDRLTARPWWSLEQSTYSSFFESLETNWKTIRNEVLLLLDNGKKSPFREEAEKLREIGDWKQFELFSQGKKSPQCDKVPLTCRIVDNFQPASRCRRGQIKFSIMEPGTHVWPHCGPTNCRLRAHLGLIVPSNVSIRVADEIKTWKEGKVLIFDDSFEHEVWHNGTTRRLILIVDVWHPELTEYERRTLSAI